MRHENDIPEPVTILEAASESIIVTDANLSAPGPRIVYANAAFERMTGWTRAAIVGLSPRVLQGAETDMRIFRGMRATLEFGGRWEGQTINYRRDGSAFVMEWSITPLMAEGGRAAHYVAVQRDVTARVEAERRIEEAQRAAREADRRKANLARYFSPSMAEILAQRDHPLGMVRRQDIAVLIVDIVGFTAMSEKLAPERVVALLRSFYRRMAEIIFAEGGSIEKFAGDGLMSLFGVPTPSGTEATSALRAAMGMIAAADRWNAKRAAAGRDPVAIGVSANFGTAVLGDIGTRESMSFTAIGDTVNTASRLQELSRALRKRLVVTEALVDRVRTEGGSARADLPSLAEAGSHGLRGRSLPIRVWTENAAPVA